ncbi:MAG: hypothetical protein DI582_07180 [Azospirillum brasilense]|nr:MAG: hypothetical protein DI582_07180 [Azospirillum brasilense]
MSEYNEFHQFDRIGEKLGLHGDLPAEKQFTTPKDGIKAAHGAASETVQQYRTALEQASEADKALLGNLRSQASEALEKLKAAGNFENGRWEQKVPGKEGKDALDTASKAFDTAEGTLKETLRGTKEIKGNALPQVSENLTKAFKEAESKAGAITKKAASPVLGRLNVNGFGAAAKKSFAEVKDFKSNKATAFGRVAGVAAGGALVLDAFRSKTKEGEDRSFVARLGEGALGASGMGLAIAGGRAF